MTDYTKLVEALLSASTVSFAWEKLMRDAADAIEALQAQLPKRGEWKRVGDCTWQCSVCGEISCCDADYCPDCGAKMREVQDG